MTDHNDYYSRRAEQELYLAQRAVLPAVANAHYRIASAYLELAAGDPKDGQSAIDIESEPRSRPHA